MNLFDLIEEVISENSSLGFGEGTPPKGKLGKKQVVSLEEETEEEHDFGGLRAQAKSTDEEGVSTSFRPMKEDTDDFERFADVPGYEDERVPGKIAHQRKRADLPPEEPKYDDSHLRALGYLEEDTEELEEMSAMGAGAVEGGGGRQVEVGEEVGAQHGEHDDEEREDRGGGDEDWGDSQHQGELALDRREEPQQPQRRHRRRRFP